MLRIRYVNSFSNMYAGSKLYLKGAYTGPVWQLKRRQSSVFLLGKMTFWLLFILIQCAYLRSDSPQADTGRYSALRKPL